MSWLSRLFGTAKDKLPRQFLTRDNKRTRNPDARRANPHV